MKTDEALAELGVGDTLLSDIEKKQLDERGYVLLHGVLSHEQCLRIRDRLDQLIIEEGELAGHEVHTEQGTDRLADLVNKGREFEICFTHPRVLAAVSYVLEGDVQLSSLNSRATRPGEGHQALHSDGTYDTKLDQFDSCQTTWLIDAFTTENGPTRLVPGSHRNPRPPKEELANPLDAHPREVHVIAPAGSVIVAPANIWHSGTRNRTDQLRRAMHAYFSRRHRPQQTRQRDFLRSETRDRLSEAALHILNV